MAYIFKEPFAVIGSKLSVGRLNAGYTTVEEPDVNLDVYGSTRFRGPINLTDSSTNFGGPDCSLGGNGSVVFGSFNSALGYNSFSQGYQNLASGNNSVTFGESLAATGTDQAVFGRFNVRGAAGMLLTVGDGLDAGNCADALRVYQSGNVYANALTTNNAINLIDPLYTGPLIQSRRMDTVPRGLGVTPNASVVYGPAVQLALSGPSGTPLQPHLTIDDQGTCIQSDCTFYGNVLIVGQTITTETQKFLTIASSVECSDPVIVVGHGQPALAGNTRYDIGLLGERPTGNTAVFWDESRLEWAFATTLEAAANEFLNFTYANLHVAGLTVTDLVTTGHVTQQGDLGVVGNASVSFLQVSNTFHAYGPAQLSSSLLVNGPSVLNTLFVANQAYFNNGIFPTEPDSWPVGQVDNRFSRAFLDALDVFDSLQQPGSSLQDTQPARIGAYGEANVYLYTTSPAPQDTVGIYFDKGQAQLPYAKSAIVQQYDRWCLKTQGVDRLTANTVTGNLAVANDLVVVGNLVGYGRTTKLANDLLVNGQLTANTATFSGAVNFGNLLPTANGVFTVGSPALRFGNAYVNQLDAWQQGGAPVLQAGGAAPNAYIFSTGGGPVALTLDVQGSPSGRTTLLQSATSLTLAGGGRPIVVANTATGNLLVTGDYLLLGNGTFVGQALSVQSQLLVSNAAVFANTVQTANLLPLLPQSTVGTANARFASAFLGQADVFGGPLQVGSSGATNVYVYSSAQQPASLTLDAGAGNSSVWTQGTANLALAVGGNPRLTIDNSTGNLTIVDDAAVGGNLVVRGAGLRTTNLTVPGTVYGNTAVWAGTTQLLGPLWAGTPVPVGNTSARFGQASLQRLDAYDTANPIRAGTAASTNVYIYSNSADLSQSVALTFDLVQSPAGRTSLIQSASGFALAAGGQTRLVANAVTGNVTISNDALVGGNLQVYGQSSSVGQDLRVLGRLAGNTAFFANLTTFDGPLQPFTPNVWSLAGPASRFGAAFFNQANLHNQSGAAQLYVGSSQNANVLIATDSQAVGQTAALSLDKGGLARTTLSQDLNQFALRQSGSVRLAANNATGNVVIPAELAVGSNLVTYGQTFVATNDGVIGGRLATNTLTVSNAALLSGNLVAVGNVFIGNTAGRFASAALASLDVYGQTPQVLVGGPASANVVLAASGDAGQTASITLSQSPAVVGSITQAANGLVLATNGLPRLHVGNVGNVSVYNNAVVFGSFNAVGNMGLGGRQARWPLDFNGYAGEKAIGLSGSTWLGGNGATQDLAYQAQQSHRFFSNATAASVGTPVLTVAQTGVLTAYGNVQPAADLTWDLGVGGARWRQLTAGNVTATFDSTFNGAVVGALAGGTGAVGLASNAQPANAYALVQQPGGTTLVNSSAGGSVRLATGNVPGAWYANGKLRLGDQGAPTRALEVVQDAVVGGALFASQTSAFQSNPTLFLANSAGWVQLGNLAIGNGGAVSLTLLGQSTVANSGGESRVFVSSSANATVSGSWYSFGTQPLLSAVKLQQLTGNSYALFAAQGGNTVQYTATASLSNATFAHSSQPCADPGTGNAVSVVPQQVIFNGFSVFGNSTGVLSNAIGGQPWLINGNGIAYSAFASIGIGTIVPRANLDVNGSFNFSGPISCNGLPITFPPFYAVSNAYVSSAADAGLLASGTGLDYPSSLVVGKFQAPTGVLEAVQGNAAVKFGGAGGSAGDLSTSAPTLSFNVANAAPNWTFTRLNQYANVATKQTVATIAADGSYVQSSDARLKYDVADVSASVLTGLKQLRPRTYNTAGDGRRKVGLIAQEVQQVFPDLVHEDEAGMLAVNYVALVPMLLKAVQTLMA